MNHYCRLLFIAVLLISIILPLISCANSNLIYGINSSAIENGYINNNPSLEDNNGQNGTDLPMDVRSLQSYIESRDREVSKRPQEFEITYEQAEKITTGMTFKEVVSIIGKGQLRPIPFSFNWHPAALYSWEICDEKGKTLFVSFDYSKEDFAELIQLSRDLFGDSEGSMDLNTYISTWESEEMTEFISDHLTVHGCSIRENDQSSQLTTEP